MTRPNGQVVEIKPVKLAGLRTRQKTRGVKMKVSLAMLLKTHDEKMSVFGLLAMLMINK